MDSFPPNLQEKIVASCIFERMSFVLTFKTSCILYPCSFLLQGGFCIWSLSLINVSRLPIKKIKKKVAFYIGIRVDILSSLVVVVASLKLINELCFEVFREEVHYFFYSEKSPFFFFFLKTLWLLSSLVVVSLFHISLSFFFSFTSMVLVAIFPQHLIL